MQSLKYALPRHAMCVVDRFKIEMGPHRNIGLDDVVKIKEMSPCISCADYDFYVRT